MSFSSAQGGVGLVEVLVAVVVFSTGIMGTLAMQITAKSMNFEAAQQLMATSLARDIVARMRSNGGGLTSYVVNEVGDKTLAYDKNCHVDSCTNVQLAEYDLFQWTSYLRGEAELVDIDGTLIRTGALVSPRACISSDAGAIEVTIVWRGSNKMTTDTRSDCGKSSGLYGMGNEQRRLLVMTTYIGSL